MLYVFRENFKGKEKYSLPVSPCSKLQDFKPLTEEQALLSRTWIYTTCAMDPCNTKFKYRHIKTITKTINVSLTTEQYLDEWKITAVRPLIKKTKSRYRIQELLPNKHSFLHVKINGEGCTNPTKDSLHRAKAITQIPECL